MFVLRHRFGRIHGKSVGCRAAVIERGEISGVSLKVHVSVDDTRV